MKTIRFFLRGGEYCRFFAVAIFCIFCFHQLFATNYYVAKNGSDSNSGTGLTVPLLTIQAALDRAQAGDTLFVRTGTYSEKLVWKTSGTAGRVIVLKNYAAEQPAVDGTGPRSATLLTINTKSYLEVSGITFQNNYFQEAKGIYVYGEGRNVTIRNCTVKNIGWTSNASLSPYSVSPVGQAHGILINGRTATGYSTVNVINTTLTNLVTGNSEALTLAGNIDGFLIDRCSVYNTKNIGIVAAGHYPWAVETGVPASVNQARNGQISNCLVYNNRRFSNDYAPAGIYIDGGSNITVIGNKSYQNGNGLSIGCENAAKQSRNIIVMNNVIYDNDNHGIVLGSNESSSRVKASRINNNTVFSNGSFGPFRSEITLQNSDSCSITNNILIPRSDSHYGVSVFGYTTTNLSIQTNLVYRYTNSATDLYVPGNPAQFVPGNTINADPLFVSSALAAPDLTLQKMSPAINRGLSPMPLVSETDAAGQFRVVNGIIDLGAYERQDGGCPTEYIIDNTKLLTGKFVAAQRLDLQNLSAAVTAPLVLSSPKVRLSTTLRMRNLIRLEPAGCQ